MSSRDGQWEYETLRPPRGATKKEAIDPKAQLNELGSDGWEFVSTVEYVGGGTKYLVFKRPADANDDSVGDDTSTETDAETTADNGTTTDNGTNTSGTDADSGTDSGTDDSGTDATGDAASEDDG